MKRINFKQKSVKELSRKKGNEDIFKRILIVTEGKKTEVNYLNKLRDEFKAKTANIEILGDSDPSPDKVYEFALNKLKSDPDFDYVYLVIDRDRHTKFYETIQRAVSKKIKGSKVKFKIISSIPCFELWLMLHFKLSTKPYNSLETGGSPADQLIKDLKKSHTCFENYEKNDCGYFEYISEKRCDAVNNSKLLLASAKSNGQEEHKENPSTRIHLLVEDMKLLVERKL